MTLILIGKLLLAAQLNTRINEVVELVPSPISYYSNVINDSRI